MIYARKLQYILYKNHIFISILILYLYLCYMNKHFKIKASDLDRILNISKEPYQSVDSQYIDGDKGKNREIIRILEKDDYITIRLIRETNDYVIFSVTEKGKYFMLSGGYVKQKKDERWKNVKDFIPKIINWVLGILSVKLLLSLFYIINK